MQQQTCNVACGHGSGPCRVLQHRRCCQTSAITRCSSSAARAPAQKQLSCGGSAKLSCRRQCLTQSSSADAGATVDLSDQPAATPSQDNAEQRISVTLRKPMGMVLAEGSNGEVFVESIDEGGNAAEDGSIQVGDVVQQTRAYILKEGKSGEYAKRGHGARPFEDYIPIMFDCKGEDFKTVMAAIGSNNERWGIFDVELNLTRPAK